MYSAYLSAKYIENFRLIDKMTEEQKPDKTTDEQKPEILKCLESSKLKNIRINLIISDPRIHRH